MLVFDLSCMGKLDAMRKGRLKKTGNRPETLRERYTGISQSVHVSIRVSVCVQNSSFCQGRDISHI